MREDARMRPGGKRFVAVALVFLTAVAARSDASAADIEAGKLIEASIAYHDPNGVWNSARIQLDVSTVYSGEFQASHDRPVVDKGGVAACTRAR